MRNDELMSVILVPCSN